jgi:hypothetical protein
VFLLKVNCANWGVSGGGPLHSKNNLLREVEQNVFIVGEWKHPLGGINKIYLW